MRNETANSSSWVNPGDDDSPIHPHPGNWTEKPVFLYVHYLRGEDGPYPTYLFQLRDPQDSVSDVDVTTAIAAIRAGEAQPIPRASGLPADWRVRAHMVFVLADKRYKLKGRGIRFMLTGGATGDKKNHTFFDGEISKDGESGFSFLRCINHRKNVSGNDLGNSTEYYEWEAEHDGPKSIRFHNDVGNNTGP